MKKLKKLNEFAIENSDQIIKNANLSLINGGLAIAEDTNTQCFTMDDTCVNNNADLHRVHSRDGVILRDYITDLNDDCWP